MTIILFVDLAAGANMLARLLDFRVAEAVSGDLNNMKTGMVYVADKGILTNEPAEMDNGPCAYFFFGKTLMDRGVQVCFHVSNTNGVAKISKTSPCLLDCPFRPATIL